MTTSSPDEKPTNGNPADVDEARSGEPAPSDASAEASTVQDAKESRSDTAPDVTAPKGKGHRKLAIGLGAVGAVLLALVGVFLYLLQPVAGVAYDDPVDAESRSTNTALYATLLAAGINDPFVDVNNVRAYVAYVHPNATANESQQIVYQRFVIGAAADAAPNVETVYVLMYLEKDPRMLWTVAMSDVRAFLRGEIDAATFDAKIDKRTF